MHQIKFNRYFLINKYYLNMYKFFMYVLKMKNDITFLFSPEILLKLISAKKSSCAVRFESKAEHIIF